MPHRRNEPGQANQDTEVIPVTGRHAYVDPVGAERPVEPGGSRSGRRSGTRRRWLVPAVLLGVLAMVYLGDLVASRGDVPRGTVVAGVPVGGLSKASADRTLRTALEPRQSRPVQIRAGSLQTALQPAASGLRVDWAGTIAAAGDQPLNPWTRLTSLFTTREREAVTQADDGSLTDALDAMNTLIRKEPTDGGVRFDGATPTAVEPVPGEELDVPAAAAEIEREWLVGLPVTLPVRSVEPTGKVTDSVIRQTITDVARPAVASEVRVLGQGRQASLPPYVIASALSFAPDGTGGLKPVLDVPRISDALRPQLAATEHPGQDASLRLVGEQPVATPSVDGRGIDYKATLAGLLDVLKRTDNRQVTAVYTNQPAKLTTERLNQLGIKGVISTFATGGFAADSGQNIRRAAETINGRILEPGETFSLNGATGLRDAPQGYVQAGIIEDGHPARGIGGGVSQLATTMYNAAYFAGMTDVAHKEHSFYISRYPPAREATVFEGAIDLKFRNEGPTGVFIETIWNPADITVRFWGTKRFEVTSTPGPRTNPVPPQTLTIPAGQPCSPSSGGEGFTATDTRTMREIATGRTTSSTRTVKYQPSPVIVCAGGPTPPPN